jgi:hypothetical protein
MPKASTSGAHYLGAVQIMVPKDLEWLSESTGAKSRAVLIVQAWVLVTSSLLASALKRAVVAKLGRFFTITTSADSIPDLEFRRKVRI